MANAAGGAKRKIEHKLKVYNASEARQRFSDLFNEVVYTGPVIVKKYNQTVAIVPAEWLERLECLEAEKRQEMAQAALRDMKERGGKDFDRLKEETGLK